MKNNLIWPLKTMIKSTLVVIYLINTYACLYLPETLENIYSELQDNHQMHENDQSTVRPIKQSDFSTPIPLADKKRHRRDNWTRNKAYWEANSEPSFEDHIPRANRVIPTRNNWRIHNHYCKGDCIFTLEMHTETTTSCDTKSIALCFNS